MLNLRFIGPFEIFKRMGKVAYELALTPKLQNIHDVFHVYILRKYNPNSSHVIEYEDGEIQLDLSKVEQPTETIDRKEQILRNRIKPLIWVLWRNHKVE